MTSTPGAPSDGPRVLVLGGGCAGALAAAAARREGCAVTVVRKGGGATAMSSGAVDVADPTLGDIPGEAAPPLAAAGGWDVGIHRLRRQRPRHPYARLGDLAHQRMRDALDLLETTAAGLDFARLEGRNLVVATELGTVKRSAMAQAAAGLDLVGLVRLVIVDLEDLGGFHGRPVVETLKWISRLAPDDIEIDLVTVPRVLDGRPLTARQLAGRLEHEAILDVFADAIGEQLEEHAPMATAILLPAVLGVDKHSTARAHLEAHLKVAVHELLAAPPSAPGARLIGALETGLLASGVTLVDGDILGAELDGPTVKHVRVRGVDAELELEADAVVLATGRFLAGGLERDGASREQVFGLPVMTGGEPVGDRFIGEFLGPRPESDHPIFRAGIAWDDRLRPQDAGGGLFADNLFAAGSVLEGYDPARDGSGLGVAALTGLLAGEGAALVAQQRHAG
jgi:glycerol-3-phosphate dehydrogenase subunit B